MPTFTVLSVINDAAQLMQIGGSESTVQVEDFAALYKTDTATAVTGYDPNSGMLKWFNASRRRVFEECWAKTGQFTYAFIQTPSTPLYFVPLNSFAVGGNEAAPTGAILRWVSDVGILQVVTAGEDPVFTPLERCSRTTLKNQHTDYQTYLGSAGSVGPPIVRPVTVDQYYFEDTEIGVYPLPYLTSPGMTVTATGLYYPADLAINASFTDMDADSARLTAYKLALLVIDSNPNDERLASLRPALQADHDAIFSTLWQRVPSAYRQPGGPYGGMAALLAGSKK